MPHPSRCLRRVGTMDACANGFGVCASREPVWYSSTQTVRRDQIRVIAARGDFFLFVFTPSWYPPFRQERERMGHPQFTLKMEGGPPAVSQSGFMFPSSESCTKVRRMCRHNSRYRWNPFSLVSETRSSRVLGQAGGQRCGSRCCELPPS